MRKIRQIGPDEWLVELDNGSRTAMTEKRFDYLAKALPQYEERYANVLLEDVDDSVAEIVEEYYYDDGEPNGWVEIYYRVDPKYGKTIPKDKW